MRPTLAMIRLLQALTLLPLALASGCSGDRGDSVIDGKTMTEASSWLDTYKSIGGRLRNAEELLELEAYDEATEEFVWLWQNMLDYEPSQYGVRLSFMAASMKELAKKSPAARKAFCKLRDKLTPAVNATRPDIDAVVDWTELNKIVGENRLTLQWFEKIKTKQGIDKLLIVICHEMAPMLRDAGRWSDIAYLYPQPIEQLRLMHLFGLHAMRRPPSQEQKASWDASTRRGFRSQAGTLYAALLAARRTEADAVAAKAKELDPSVSMVMALVDIALDAHQSRQQHLEWLDAAQKNAKSLKQQSEIDALRERLLRLLGADRQPKKRDR